MRRPRWLNGWGKGKHLFEGSLIIDLPDIKVVEASFDQKPVFFAVGALQRREIGAPGKASTTTVEENNETDFFKWKIFYDSTALPDFISIDKAKDFMAGTVAVSSSSASVYGASTIYIASGGRSAKGNAPVLLDYELARKIEEARKRKDK